MDKLHKALIWLAAAAMVVGLVITFLYMTMTMNTLPNGGVLGRPEGPISVLFTTLSTQKFAIVVGLSGLLSDGAIALALIFGLSRRKPEAAVAVADASAADDALGVVRSAL